MASKTITNLASKEDINLLREDVNKLSDKLSTQISDVKVDLIKWCVGIWICSFIAIVLMIIVLYLRK